MANLDLSERRKLQSMQTEANIIKAGLRLMKERGFDQVSIREICREAGVTTGAFYHHFPSKDVLLLQCFTPLKMHLTQALESSEALLAAGKLRVLVTAYAEFMSEDGQLLSKYYEYRLGNPSASASFDSEDFLLKMMSALIEQVQSEGSFSTVFSAEEIARFLHRHYRGIVIDWILSQYSYSLKEKMLEEFDLFVSLLQR